MAKKKNWLMTLAIWLALVGGAVHALDSYNIYNLLGLFQGFAPIVQLIAGVSTVWVAVSLMMKKR